MNPLLSIIALFTSLKKDLADRFNAALVNRPPLEQVEGANIAASVLREIEWGKERLERMGSELGTHLSAAATIIPGFEYRPGESVEVAATRLLEKMDASTIEKAITDGITAKLLLRMPDHENALTAAREAAAEEAKKTAETEFNAKLEKIELLATRRKEAIDRVGVFAAGTLTDDVLAGDDFTAALTALEGRIAKLKEHNITESGRKDFYEPLVAKASEAEFDGTLEIILKAAGGSLPAIAPEPPKTPAAPKPADPGFSASTPPAGSPVKKKVIC